MHSSSAVPLPAKSTPTSWPIRMTLVLAKWRTSILWTPGAWRTLWHGGRRTHELSGGAGARLPRRARCGLSGAQSGCRRLGGDDSQVRRARVARRSSEQARRGLGPRMEDDRLHRRTHGADVLAPPRFRCGALRRTATQRERLGRPFDRREIQPGRSATDGFTDTSGAPVTDGETFRLTQLTPETRERVQQTIDGMAAIGHDVYVGQTLRTQTEQTAAQARGTTSANQSRSWHQLGRAADLRKRNADGSVDESTHDDAFFRDLFDVATSVGLRTLAFR